MKIQPVMFRAIHSNIAQNNKSKQVSFGRDLYGNPDNAREEFEDLKDTYRKETANSWNPPSFNEWLNSSSGYVDTHCAGSDRTRGSKLEEMLREEEEKNNWW